MKCGIVNVLMLLKNSKTINNEMYYESLLPSGNVPLLYYRLFLNCIILLILLCYNHLTVLCWLVIVWYFDKVSALLNAFKIQNNTNLMCKNMEYMVNKTIYSNTVYAVHDLHNQYSIDNVVISVLFPRETAHKVNVM